MDPEQSFQDLAQRVRPHWDEARSERLLLGISHAKRRRRSVRAAAAGSGYLAIALALAVWWQTRPGATHFATKTALPTPPAAASVSTPATQFAEVRELRLNSSLALHSSPAREEYDVDQGAYSFRTIAQPPGSPVHPFVVVVGGVTIEHVGTAFTVEKLPEGRARVFVVEGRVRVTALGAVEILSENEGGIFPREASGSASSHANEKPQPSLPNRGATAPREKRLDAVPAKAAEQNVPASTTTRSKSWQELASEGAVAEAYAALGQAPPTTVADLLLASDLARATHDYAGAAKYLQLLIDRYPSHPQAAAANFTLGKLYLEALGQPLRAAQAFERARVGSLTEDALAREVEALSRAGQSAQARARAEQYLRAYPAGRSLVLVRKYGFSSAAPSASH